MCNLLELIWSDVKSPQIANDMDQETNTLCHAVSVVL